MIRNPFSGKCVDIYNFEMNNGADLKGWSCGAVTGSWNQKFVVAHDSMVHNPTTGRCIDMPNSADGTQLVIWECPGAGLPEAKWFLTADGWLVNPASGKCVDYDNGGGTATNGKRIQVWGCSGQPNQKWVMKPDGLLYNSATVGASTSTPASPPVRHRSVPRCTSGTATVRTTRSGGWTSRSLHPRVKIGRGRGRPEPAGRRFVMGVPTVVCGGVADDCPK